MHGLMDWRSALVFTMYLYACAFLLCLIIDGVKALATRATSRGVRARLDRAKLERRRASLAHQRNQRARESRESAALAIMAASPQEGILGSAIGPATRARLMGVDELLMDDSEERALFI